MELLSPIASARCSLAVMTPELLTMMSDNGDASERPFSWPQWWPDDVDRPHVAVWRDRAIESEAQVAWGPRAIVDGRGEMIGHAGFHRPPQPLEAALSDPTFVGTRAPTAGGVVEVGYTVFPSYRRRGYATEAVTTLLRWAATTTEVSAVLAAVAENNDASVRVLEHIGDFVKIGTCRTGDGVVEVVFRRDL